MASCLKIILRLQDLNSIALTDENGKGHVTFLTENKQFEQSMLRVFSNITLGLYFTAGPSAGPTRLSALIKLFSNGGY